MGGNSAAEWAGVGAAIAVGAASLVLTITNTSDVNERLNTQDEERFAIYVDLGEVPLSEYDEDYLKARLGEPDPIWWGVINASPVAIRGVWVEGPDEQFIWIDEVQRCSVYVLGARQDEGTIQPRPLEFDPTFLHFTDPREDWRLSDEGKLSKRYGNPFRDIGDDNGVAYSRVLQDCVA
jgi:hypothetical protein